MEISVSDTNISESVRLIIHFLNWKQNLFVDSDITGRWNPSLSKTRMRFSSMLASENAVNLTRWLTGDSQLDDSGKTQVTHIETFLKKRSKWRHNRRSRDVNMPHPTDSPQISSARRSINGSFRRFHCVLAPEEHVKNMIMHELPRITMFWSLVRWFATYWRITPLVTKKIVINGKPFIIRFIRHSQNHFADVVKMWNEYIFITSQKHEGWIVFHRTYLSNISVSMLWPGFNIGCHVCTFNLLKWRCRVFLDAHCRPLVIWVGFVCISC